MCIVCVGVGVAGVCERQQKQHQALVLVNQVTKLNEAGKGAGDGAGSPPVGFAGKGLAVVVRGRSVDVVTAAGVELLSVLSPWLGHVCSLNVSWLVMSAA
jgi:hypothetical protein